MSADPEIEAEIAANMKAHSEGLYLRATQTPESVKTALKAVGHALPDDEARAHYATIREYIGFLQITCAVNLPAPLAGVVLLAALDPEDEAMVDLFAWAKWRAGGDDPGEVGALRRGTLEPHDGDCTGQPYGCGACTCVMALEEAKAMIADLRSVIGQGGPEANAPTSQA